jgi:hypothetical protein
MRLGGAQLSFISDSRFFLTPQLCDIIEVFHLI